MAHRIWLAPERKHAHRRIRYHHHMMLGGLMLRALRVTAAALALAAIFAIAPQRAAARTAVDVPDIAPGASTPIVFVDALQQSAPWSSSSPLSLSPEGNILSLRR